MDIKNVNVDLIKIEINNLFNEIYSLNYILIKKNNADDPDDITCIRLKNKYKCLFNTSKTLFNYILSEINKDNFNKNIFDKKINSMLSMISKIQKSEITQDDASKKVGIMLADEYIPSNLREPTSADK